MNSARLNDFMAAMTAPADRVPPGFPLMKAACPVLADLVTHDDWLPAPAGVFDPLQYRYYLLHCETAERFSLVSFVWGPGQQTLIHDHQVWGLIGMLRGSEISQSYGRAIDGGLVQAGPPVRLDSGQIETVAPRLQASKLANSAPAGSCCAGTPG